jgi:DNA modification methylase
MPGPPPPRARQRRALSARGGPITAAGEPAERRRLVEALDLPPDADARQLTHGFHSYPARFHPLLVRRLLAGRGAPGVVLDPFVGGGTTLVEAMLIGARARGSDVNPLAVELSRLKAAVWPVPRRARLVERAAAVSARSLERVKARARTRGSGERYDDPRRYAPHVFRELVGLREELDDEPDAELLRALLLILSSIVVKVSRQPSDTAAGTVERAVAKGFASRLFARKAEELAARLGELAAAVPPATPPSDVRLADARALTHVDAESVDLVVTSPPYLGTYDYAEQHARRYGWLGLDPGPFAAREIGARRGARAAADPLAAWQADVDAFVAEIARVLAPRGRAYVVIGDSAVGTRAIAGDQALRRAAERARLTLLAAAAQERPNFYAPTGRRTRREHLVALAR